MPEVVKNLENEIQLIKSELKEFKIKNNGVKDNQSKLTLLADFKFNKTSFQPFTHKRKG